MSRSRRSLSAQRPGVQRRAVARAKRGRLIVHSNTMLASLLLGFPESDLVAIWIADNEIASPPGVRGQRAGNREIVAKACSVNGFDVAHVKVAAREGSHRWHRCQDQGQGDVISPQQGKVVPHGRKDLKPKMSFIERHRPGDVSHTKRGLKALKDESLVHWSG